MYPLEMLNMIWMFFLAVNVCAGDVSASRYIPRSWTEICDENVSVPTQSQGLPPPILIDLRCHIPKSYHFQWKLNDLRLWTFNKGINDQTTPSNRTVIYNISLICETDANISLPWPMRVAGLVELHVFFCRLLDRYDNFMSAIPSTIGDDMKILEIRHSIWILNQTNTILDNSGVALNLTNDYDCGQDSSLEIIVTSNVSDSIGTDLDVEMSTRKYTDNIDKATTKYKDSSGGFTSNWQTMTEDGRIKGTVEVTGTAHWQSMREDERINETPENVADTVIFNTKGSDNSTKKKIQKPQNQKIESVNSRQTDPSQTDSLQTDSLQTDSLQIDSRQIESRQTDSLQTDSQQKDSRQTGSWQTDPSQTTSRQTDPLQITSRQTDSRQIDSPHTNPRQTEEDYIKLMIQILRTTSKCSFPKLKIIDESIAMVTPLYHFEHMAHQQEFPMLEIMNYSYIGLKELPQELSKWRIYFPKLTHIDLSHNYISKVQISNYPSTSGMDVTTFNLRHNNITTIDMAILKSWAAVDNLFVDVRDNPINCGCGIKPLLPYLVDDSIFKDKLAPYVYVKYLQCSTPEVLKGKQLYKLDPNFFQCGINTSTNRVLIALCVLLGILIIFTVAIIRFKVEIRILLYTRLHVRLPCDTNVHINAKTFDAFVSYSNEDAVWVHDNLVTYLENVTNQSLHTTNVTSNHSNIIESATNERASFRLCIHQRDFVPGKTIFDNIVDSIERSRHTIIVLSPSFIRSQWAMEEMRQAYRQSLLEKSRHLIIVLLQKVSKKDMDPLIRLCCKTFTYLEISDSFFKDRLVFALSTTRRSQMCPIDRPAAEINNSNVATIILESIVQAEMCHRELYRKDVLISKGIFPT